MLPKMLCAMGFAWACFSLGPGAQDATAAAPPPEPQVVLNLEPGPGNPRNSEGDFIRLQDGRILFAYSHFTGGSDDDASAYLATRVSSDDGQTWTATDEILVPNEGKMNTMSVSFLRLKNGPIALFYLVKQSSADCRLVVRFSSDETKSWTPPRLCMDTGGYFVVNNDRIIQLQGGRIVAPAARHSAPGENYHSSGEALCFLSDDSGQTWRPSKSIVAPPPGSRTGLQEPGLIELRDGRLMMLCRTDLGCQYQAYSADGGDTWSAAAPTSILSPVSPATVGRIPETRDLLMVWNDHRNIAPELKNKRTPLTVAISRDEGQSWERTQKIEDQPDGWYCYTAMEFAGNHVLLAYCAGDRKIGGLNRTRILRVPVSWLYRE